jgi:large subunit ribosomal protein L10
MRKEKQYLLDEAKDYIDHSKAFIITKYEQMDVASFSDLRRALHKQNSFFEVIKKRILKKALENAHIQIDEELRGHIGVVFTQEDPMESLKTLIDFDANAEAGNKKLELLAGFIDQVPYKAQDMERLSKLPPKDQMRAQLLGTIAAPMIQTLGVMQSILASILVLLDNKIKKENKQ